MTLRHFMFHNFWLKLFSIALGTIIWLAIHHSIDNNFDLTESGTPKRLVKQTLQVPISAVRQEGDPRNFAFSPTNATITIVGEADVLRKLGTRNIRVFVDLNDFHSSGPVQLDLLPGAPDGINVTEYKPHSVTVTVETNSH